jgi:hypothetical protein
MDHAHRERIKHLFRWWNGHVFSFEAVPGTSGKDDDGFDSGMDEAEAALNSDEEFSGGARSGEDFGGENLDDDNNRPDLSLNFVQLTISERSGVPSNPVAAPVHAIAVPWVREPTLGDVRFFWSFLIFLSHFLPQNIVNPTAGGSGSGHSAANSTEEPGHSLTNIRDMLQVINIMVYQFVIQVLIYSCQGLLVDELRNWIQEHEITSTKSRKKEGKFTFWEDLCLTRNDWFFRAF